MKHFFIRWGMLLILSRRLIQHLNTRKTIRDRMIPIPYPISMTLYFWNWIFPWTSMMTISNLLAYQKLRTLVWILQMIVVLLAVGEPYKVVSLHKMSEILNTWLLSIIYHSLKLFCIDQAQIFGNDWLSPRGDFCTYGCMKNTFFANKLRSVK